MANKILYVVLNNELKMSAGKAAAQAIHAVVNLQGACGTHQFADEARRTVIVLGADNSEQLRNLHEYLKKTNLYSKYYIDEGVNEISPYSVTALAVSPFDDDDEEKREIFENFSLFSGVYHEAGSNRNTRIADFIEAIPYYGNRPWHVKKTIKWLRRQP